MNSNNPNLQFLRGRHNRKLRVKKSFHGVAYGYVLGSNSVIEKFPFSHDANSTDVGDLPATVNNAGSQSSLINGYVSGDLSIYKFSFSSDSDGIIIYLMLSFGICL